LPGWRINGEQQVVQGQPELAGDAVQRADRGLGLARLDLGDEAGRHAEAAGQLAQADLAALALHPQARADHLAALQRGSARHGTHPRSLLARSESVKQC
jgi:hypothetical protein